MKKFPFYLILALIFVVTTASTCSHDDDDNSNNGNVNPPSNSTAISNAASSGNWRITYFFDTDHEETAHFSNYAFTFGPNNALTATNGTNTYTGTWSVTGSSLDDNDNSNSLHFNISFASPDDFEELSDDWHVISYTANRIVLRDVSGGNGGTDLLTFEKN